MPKGQLLFSAVFGFRNPSKEIFSESDEINTEDLKIPGSSRAPEKGQRGARGAPPHRAARPRGGAPPYCVSPPETLLRRLFAYKTPRDLNPRYQLTKLQKDSRGAAAIVKLQFGGQKSLFRHRAGTGECPRKPSPSTPPPPSCSVSSSPMDYGF